MRATVAVVVSAVLLAALAGAVFADCWNDVFTPCDDSKIQLWGGFTFGIAFSGRDSFFSNGVQFSPCDSRLSLASNRARLAVYRPKVDEISLLTITDRDFGILSGGYMVAFAGKKYAARSSPTFVGNSSYVVTSFTLVLEFRKGTLVNLLWKTDGCSSCLGKSSFVCLDKQVCAVKASKCSSVDCSIGVQLAFSGTDIGDAVLNSWYEVSKLRQYSLYALYSDVRGSLISPFEGLL